MIYRPWSNKRLGEVEVRERYLLEKMVFIIIKKNYT